MTASRDAWWGNGPPEQRHLPNAFIDRRARAIFLREATLAGTIRDSRKIESEMMRKRGSNRPPNRRVGNKLDSSAKFESRDTSQIDRADLVAEDHRIPCLASVAQRDRDLARILRVTR